MWCGLVLRLTPKCGLVRPQALGSQDSIISWNGQNLKDFDDMFDISNVWELFALDGEDVTTEEGRKSIEKAVKEKDHKELNRRRWSNGRSKCCSF
jgi:hypothetical protein